MMKIMTQAETAERYFDFAASSLTTVLTTVRSITIGGGGARGPVFAKTKGASERQSVVRVKSVRLRSRETGKSRTKDA